MPGQIKHMLDSIMQQRSKGNATLLLTTKTKLILKGFDPDRFGADSPDDPVVMTRVRAVATELGIHL